MHTSRSNARDALVVLALVATGCSGVDRADGPTSGGAPLPDIALPDLRGRDVSLRANVGKGPTLVTFWATWCSPCKDEHQLLQRLHTEYASQGLSIVAISVDGPQTRAEVDSYVSKWRYGFKFVVDPETRAVEALNPKTDMPFYLLVDREGRIVHTRQGYSPAHGADLEASVRALLRPAAGK